MKKIAIISELNLKNTNYGNRLQAFALNKYIDENFKCKVQSIILNGPYDINKKTKKYNFTLMNKVKRIPGKIKKILNKNKYNFSERVAACNNFTKNRTKLCEEEMNFEKLQQTDYDYFIVGSDVVWAQVKGAVHRIRFLDFETQKGFEKIAYAPSFGKDWIPKENEQTIKECLKDFKALSVREKSSIKMLNKLGISNIEHVCDPTLLFNKESWKNIENKIEINDRYIFVYLLGKSKKQRDEIKKMAQEMNLKIVSIPHANQEYGKVDEEFGDYKIHNCSPEEWLWLIDNSEYVVTDSFHGVVFATIFEKKFIVLKRIDVVNINNRMIDYLDTIDECDKILEELNSKRLKEMEWDYSNINLKLEKFIADSKQYLKRSILEE